MININILELKNSVDLAIQNLRNYDNPEDVPVLVNLSEPSIGARASASVRYVGMGFDWEHNQFRITTDKALVCKGNSLNDIKPVKLVSYNGRNYYWCPRCDGRVSKDDRYCRECGQKMK